MASIHFEPLLRAIGWLANEPMRNRPHTNPINGWSVDNSGRKSTYYSRIVHTYSCKSAPASSRNTPQSIPSNYFIHAVNACIAYVLAYVLFFFLCCALNRRVRLCLTLTHTSSFTHTHHTLHNMYNKSSCTRIVTGCVRSPPSRFNLRAFIQLVDQRLNINMSSLVYARASYTEKRVRKKHTHAHSSRKSPRVCVGCAHTPVSKKGIKGVLLQGRICSKDTRGDTRVYI